MLGYQLVVTTACCKAEEILPIEIKFDASTQSNPLIELLDCESSKGDSAIFQSDGLKLEQTSGTKASQPAGFTFKKSNQDAFQFSVQFETKHCVPREGNCFCWRRVLLATTKATSILYRCFADETHDMGTCNFW